MLNSPSKPMLTVAISAFAVLAFSEQALAEEDILTLSLSPEYIILDSEDDTWHGTGVLACASYGVDEYTSLDFQLGYDIAWQEGSDQRTHSLRFGAGAQYGLDATEFVPYLGAGLEGYLDQTGGKGFEIDLSARVTLGLDWILTDAFMAGIYAGYHLLVTDVQHMVATFGVRMGWRIDTL